MLATAHALTRGYDIIQYFAFGPSLLAWAPRLCGAKSVASVRTLEWQRGKWGWLAREVLRLGERAAVYCPHATSTVSLPAKTYLEQCYGRPISYIPNGISPPVFRPPQRMVEFGLTPNDYILFVGRLVPEKGCHDLLRAFSRVRTDKSLVLAGAPSYSEAYTAELRRLADHRVHFVGHVAGEFLEELYSNAYFYVQPSHVEGMSNSLLEAMSHQRCVLVSNIPENLAVIGSYGATFRCGDVDDLERNLRAFLDNPGTVEERGKRAGEWVLNRYSWDVVADATETLYRQLLGHVEG
jgi:glycosyltransferase involved in cell wall biosynthesis